MPHPRSSNQALASLFPHLPPMGEENYKTPSSTDEPQVTLPPELIRYSRGKEESGDLLQPPRKRDSFEAFNCCPLLPDDLSEEEEEELMESFSGSKRPPKLAMRPSSSWSAMDDTFLHQGPLPPSIRLDTIQENEDEDWFGSFCNPPADESGIISFQSTLESNNTDWHSNSARGLVKPVAQKPVLTMKLLQAPRRKSLGATAA